MDTIVGFFVGFIFNLMGLFFVMFCGFSRKAKNGAIMGFMANFFMSIMF